MRLRLIGQFAAAHRLEGHPGLCQCLHGHTWRVVVTLKVIGPSTDPTPGIDADFSTLKGILKSVLPDHQFLNEAYPQLANPTAELLAVEIATAMDDVLVGSDIRNVQVEEVELWESDTAAAVVRKGDDW